jgi:hypothetical protein
MGMLVFMMVTGMTVVVTIRPDRGRSPQRQTQMAVPAAVRVTVYPGSAVRQLTLPTVAVRT